MQNSSNYNLIYLNIINTYNLVYNQIYYYGCTNFKGAIDGRVSRKNRSNTCYVHGLTNYMRGPVCISTVIWRTEKICDEFFEVFEFLGLVHVLNDFAEGGYPISAEII